MLFAFDSDQKEIAHSSHGGVVEFEAPADGEYFLRLSDLTFRGGSAFYYRLQAGTLPHIDFVTPFFGKPGEKSTHLLAGRNLPGSKKSSSIGMDGKPLEELAIEIEFPTNSADLISSTAMKPASASLQGFDWVFQTKNGLKRSYFLNFAAVAASEKTNIDIPCEVRDGFPQRNPNSYTFKAAKGAVYWIEIFSERLNFPTDPFMVIQRIKKDDKGEEQYSDIQEVDDNDQNPGGTTFKTASRDPLWRFEVKEDGAYRALVRDLFNEGKGKRAYPFRLSIRNESPDFEMVAVFPPPPNPNKDAKTAPVWSGFLRKEDKIPLDLYVLRRDGFNGEISLSMEGTPTGISFEPKVVPAGTNKMQIMMISGSDVSAFQGPIQLVGKAKMANGEIVRHARGVTQVWAVEDYSREAILSRLTRGMDLGTSGKKPRL